MKKKILCNIMVMMSVVFCLGACGNDQRNVLVSTLNPKEDEKELILIKTEVKKDENIFTDKHVALTKNIVKTKQGLSFLTMDYLEDSHKTLTGISVWNSSNGTDWNLQFEYKNKSGLQNIEKNTIVSCELYDNSLYLMMEKNDGNMYYELYSFPVNSGEPEKIELQCFNNKFKEKQECPVFFRLINTNQILIQFYNCKANLVTLTTGQTYISYSDVNILYQDCISNQGFVSYSRDENVFKCYDYLNNDEQNIIELDRYAQEKNANEINNRVRITLCEDELYLLGDDGIYCGDLFEKDLALCTKSLSKSNLDASNYMVTAFSIIAPQKFYMSYIGEGIAATQQLCIYQ